MDSIIKVFRRENNIINIDLNKMININNIRYITDVTTQKDYYNLLYNNYKLNKSAKLNNYKSTNLLKNADNIKYNLNILNKYINILNQLFDYNLIKNYKTFEFSMCIDYIINSSDELAKILIDTFYTKRARSNKNLDGLKLFKDLENIPPTDDLGMINHNIRKFIISAVLLECTAGPLHMIITGVDKLSELGNPVSDMLDDDTSYYFIHWFTIQALYAKANLDNAYELLCKQK